MPTKNEETVTKKSETKSSSGAPDSNAPTTETTTAESVAKRLEGVHPKARTKVRDTAEFVSARLQEYTIQPDGHGYYKVVPYKGGALPEYLSGLYLTHRTAEQDLISYLQSTDKFGKAIWPGK